MAVLKRLRDLREDSDLSQRQLAEQLNMYKTTYARYESGQQKLPFETAVKIADFYGISLDYLAGRTNNKQVK